MPTAEQILSMMQARMGDALPKWPAMLKNMAPDLLAVTAMSSAQSVGREASPLPAKYRHLIAVGAALGRGQESCARSQARAAQAVGASAEEVLDAVRIARHMAASGVLDTATALLGEVQEG
jgi:AhpD family alkylhydroperoxidase